VPDAWLLAVGSSMLDEGQKCQKQKRT